MKNVIQGKAMWAKVYDPDTKFSANGIYSVSVLVPEEEAQEMCEHLDGLAKKKLAEEIKNNPKRKDLTLKKHYAPATDKDGNETGEIEFKVKVRVLSAPVAAPLGLTAFATPPSFLIAKPGLLSTI